MSSRSLLLTKGEVIIVLNGTPYQADSSHPNYDAILAAIQDKDWDSIPALMDKAGAIVEFSQGKVTVVDGEVVYGDKVLHNSIAARILTMLEEGFNIEPMVLFLENLMQNPSKDAVNELYEFLEVCKLPITEDGHFIAYKRVRDDFKSFHDGKTDNSIGKVLEMPRASVDSNRHRTCSDGLHFCSLNYLGEFYSGTGKVILLKINPRDVVSIPSDYNNAKGRACRYEVLSEVGTKGGNITKDVFNQSVVSAGATDNAQEFKEGYVYGYDQGRAKADKDLFKAEDTARYAGYMAGYKDGRGKQKRKYNKLDL